MICIIADQMLKWCEWTIHVEAVPLVRNDIEKPSTLPDLAQVSSHCAQWVFAMFQHVTCDDEVNGVSSDAGQRLAIIKDIDWDQIVRVKFGELGNMICNRTAVHVARSHTWRKFERCMKRAYLQPAASHQIVCCNPAAIFPDVLRQLSIYDPLYGCKFVWCGINLLPHGFRRKFLSSPVL